MGEIFFTSDTHFGHNKEFLYGSRGFNSVEEHAEEIIKRWNSVVKAHDVVYFLGDMTLSTEYEEKALEWVKRLNGEIYWIAGNHDTNNRIDKFLVECDNIAEFRGFAERMKLDKKSLLLSHYPTITANRLDSDEPGLKNVVYNLHGHTHQKTNFSPDLPLTCYHVGLDSHDLTPVSWSEINADLNKY